ncbi:MAG: hypothetical protein E7156_03480 [Streptococcus gallolyticus]|uniref:Uncharacterized protein n=1 Tax=Streptococcus gallolyticus TaxID=315405 RepID=A0A927XK86_9STRE|nr:hypothetical protein [Streptococcus gallolyticus]
MTTIKMESEAVSGNIEELNSKITIYKEAVVSATAQFTNFEGALTGESYTALTSQINSTLETQKLLVAECMVLSQKMKNFIEEISEAESSVSFE